MAQRTQNTGPRTVRSVGTRVARTAVIVALAVLAAGGCTHAVKLDAPAEPIAIDVTVHIEQVVVLTAAR